MDELILQSNQDISNPLPGLENNGFLDIVSPLQTTRGNTESLRLLRLSTIEAEQYWSNIVSERLSYSNIFGWQPSSNNSVFGQLLTVQQATLPTITISASDANAAETIAGQTANPGLFTLTRTGNIASSLAVNYTISGTATNGTDYQTLTNSIIFAAGLSTAIINVTPSDDTVFEGNETVILNLATSANYTLGTAKTATVNLVDNDKPTISISATDASGGEILTGQTVNPGKFTLTRTGNTTSSLIVNYSVAGTATNGTDYNTLTKTATFAAGSATALINVTPIDDAVYEGNETVIVTLASGTSYILGTAKTGTVNLVDNDKPTITLSATDASAAETLIGQTVNPGRFTLTRTGNKTASLTVNYTIAGTATNETDYNSISNSVTFAAGSATAIINVTPIDDAVYEGNETVVVTLASGTSYILGTAKTATVNIADNDSSTNIKPTITISASDANAGETLTGETANPGKFTLTRTGSTASSLTVNYAVAGTATNGTDYNNLTKTATFAAGSATALIDVNVKDDAVYEGNETVIVTLASGTSYILGTAKTGTVNLVDNDSSTNIKPTISVSASDANAGEILTGQTANPGRFTLTRTGSTASSLTVNYSVAGTATNGTDYNALNGTATFAVGSSTTIINLTPINDSFVEGDETVVVNLSSATNYNLGTVKTATVKIVDNNDQAGNSLSAATSIIVGSTTNTYIDWVGNTDPYDYYSFNLGVASNFNLKLNGLTANANVQLLNSNGDFIQGSYNTGTAEDSFKYNLNPGSYYIKVYSELGTANTNYNLNVFAIPDYAGNSLNTSRSISLSSVVGSYSDWVGDADANDYYGFNLNVASKFNLKLNGLTADANVQLLNSNGGFIQGSYNTGTTEDSFSYDLNPGNYYINVYREVSGTNTNYNLNVSATSSNVASNITVTSPNGGESFQAGSSYNITWNDNISENAKIELYKGGSFYSSLFSSTASDGSETWTLPSNLTSGSDYQIKITSVSNSNVYDWGNNYFTVSSAPYITVISPHGGNTFQAGSSYNITWNDNILENVKIDLYKAGNLYSTLFSSTASDGSETWTVPSNLASGSDYQIKISSVNNSIIYDYGNTNFTINAVKPDLKKYWFYYNFNPADYLAADSYNGSVIAPVGTYTLGNYQPENDYDFQNVTTEVGYNGKYRIYQVDDYDDNLTNEAGRVFVHAYTDRDNGTVQNFTPYKYSQGQAAGTNYLGSEVDYINSSQSAGSKFGQDYYEADPDTISIPTNRWKAEYFNGTNPDSGTPIKVEDAGDGSQTLNLNWGSGSPSGVPADNFSAWFTTTRYLNEGLYKITTNSDDGIAVFVGATGKRVEQWIDKGSSDTYTGYFYVGNGEVPIKVKYYENGGGASVRVEINSVNPNSIQEPVNAGTNWAASVFTLNGDTLPNTDFYLDGSRNIASIDLGSATRNDGLKGINFNYGTRAFDENSNLPHDNYAVRAYTQAYFDGGTYKFRVSGDDAFQVFARKWGGGDTYILSSSSSWQQGYQEGTVTLDAGSYDLHFHYVEQAGNAAFDLSWEKVAPLSSPDIEIYEDFSGVSNSPSTFKNLLTKATDNWDTIITNHRYSNGNLNVSFVFDYNYNWGGSYGYVNELFGTSATVYLNPNLIYQSSGFIVRLVMHEIGHLFGLAPIGTPEGHYDYNNQLYTSGLMNYAAYNGNIADNQQMYDELTYLGYKYIKYGIDNNGNLTSS
jgi:Calx-beta domain/Ser-Thr-rich glycosyl-phosphatidyl-inositol-anchored membrane family